MMSSLHIQITKNTRKFTHEKSYLHHVNPGLAACSSYQPPWKGTIEPVTVVSHKTSNSLDVARTISVLQKSSESLITKMIIN